MRYQHTQTGWVVLVATSITVALALPGMLGAALHWPVVGLVGMVVLVDLLFGWLRVSVDDKQLQAVFGLGLIRKTIPLEQVRAYTKVRNHWIYGWGIRFFPGGTLYNVSGLDAVEFQLTDGSRVRIGTDEPDALIKSLHEVLGELEPLSEEEKAKAKGKGSTSKLAAVGVFVALLIVGVIAYAFVAQMEAPEVVVGPEAFNVSSFTVSDSIPLASVQELTLADKLPTLEARTNGFSFSDTKRGSFRVTGWGHTRLYVELDHPPFVVMRTADGYLAVGFEDPAATKALHAKLKAALPSL